MSAFNLSSAINPKPYGSHFSPISFHSQLNSFPKRFVSTSHRYSDSSKPRSIRSGLRELRERIETVKNTQKVTEAMKLVAAAKVRRAQEAVINGRPFAETLAEVLYDINEQCRLEDVEIPLTEIRPVRRVALVVIAGDRGLCGGFNSAVLKKAESRIAELRNLQLQCGVISIGKKGNAYFQRRSDSITVESFIEGESFPTAKEAQVIADEVFSLFLSAEVDKVELLYTKFVSLIKSEPVIQTLLPLGTVCDVNGRSIDYGGNELFRLTTKEGKLAVERDRPDFEGFAGIVRQRACGEDECNEQCD
ncbi:ATP synthase gamma chain, chloroplastic-like isoform X2 [Andrographis paniculata]|uniref:ATP synthase gamma chain, chloroplastic-like isoform X2 n=1 Tax=Andrographis paniculata TaxID=175694 RepID=UPI0021E776F7|nr:ATP synthase gamma chain, chloroplastic-like isoform X2 [Andrographis paniculata]